MRRRLLKIALFCVVTSLLAGVGALLVSDRLQSGDQRMATPPSGDRTQSVRVQTLQRDTVLQGYGCARGWVHFYPTGALREFASTEPLSLGRDTIPSGTWVTLDPNGTIVRCSFPADTMIQGQLCRGTGGPKGVGTSFHSTGSLKTFFPPADTMIQGVNCAGGIFDQFVVLDERGKLREATLAEDAVLEGGKCRKGDRVAWDQAGRLVSVTRPTWTQRGLRTLFDWLE